MKKTPKVAPVTCLTALQRLLTHQDTLLEALGEAAIKPDVAADLKALQEGLYLQGLAVLLDGTLSFEAVCQALQAALKAQHQAERVAAGESSPAYSCPYQVVSTSAATFIYADETEGGKLYRQGYRMNGTVAVLEGEPTETVLAPVTTQQESVDLIEARPSGALKLGSLNRSLNIIEGTTLIGPLSSNGAHRKRRYSETALKKIAEMAEGLPGYLNHTAPELAFKPRDVKELAVRHRNVRYDPATQTVKSDMHVMEHHAPLVFNLAEKFGDHIGNSLVSKGVVTMEGDTEVVQDIVALRSADLVTDPASTKGLFEGRGTEEHPITLTDLIESVRTQPSSNRKDTLVMDFAAILSHFKEHPEQQKLMLEHLQVVPKAEAEKQAALLQESITGLTKERDTLKGALDEQQAKVATQEKALTEAKVKIDGFEAQAATAAKRATLTKTIQEHKLHKEFGKIGAAVSETFVGTLMEAEEKEWGKLLDDRYASLKGVPVGEGAKSRVKDEQPLSESGGEPAVPAGAHLRLINAISR
jgi:hypothetical protein